jgi:hypothetical protein
MSEQLEIQPVRQTDVTIVVDNIFDNLLPSDRVAERPASWEPDTWIWNDQTLVFEVRDKGLVVL